LPQRWWRRWQHPARATANQRPRRCTISYLLACPNCGPRPVDEYGYGGEVTFRSTSSEDERALFSYLYFRRNVAGPQKEWWFHTSGCREWFQAERDTRDNTVIEVARAGGLGGAGESPATAAAASEAADG
jgi:sarcosine oxidase subunit delta